MHCEEKTLVFLAIKNIYSQTAEALSVAARNDSQTARADREAMSAGGKDSEAEALDFSIAVVSLIYTYYILYTLVDDEIRNWYAPFLKPIFREKKTNLTGQKSFISKEAFSDYDEGKEFFRHWLAKDYFFSSRKCFQIQKKVFQSKHSRKDKYFFASLARVGRFVWFWRQKEKGSSDSEIGAMEKYVFNSSDLLDSLLDWRPDLTWLDCPVL